MKVKATTTLEVEDVSRSAKSFTLKGRFKGTAMDELAAEKVKEYIEINGIQALAELL